MNAMEKASYNRSLNDYALKRKILTSARQRGRPFNRVHKNHVKPLLLTFAAWLIFLFITIIGLAGAINY